MGTFFKAEYMAKLAYQYKYRASFDIGKVFVNKIGKFTKEYQNYVLSLFYKVLEEIGKRVRPSNDLLFRYTCIYLARKGYYSGSEKIFTYRINNGKMSLELEAKLKVGAKPDILITYSDPNNEFGIAVECKMGRSLEMYKKAISQCKRYRGINFIKNTILVSMTKIPDAIRSEVSSIYDFIFEEVYPGSEKEIEMNKKLKEFLNNISNRG